MVIGKLKIKKIFICLILLFFNLFFLFFFAAPIPKAEEPLYIEPGKKITDFEKIREYIYTVTILEDFETTTYSDKNLKFMQSDGQGVLSISDNYPAPVNNSKKYLGVKVFAKKGDRFRIEFTKPIEITKYCKTISMWVYGEKIAGELSIMLRDSSGINHLVNFGYAASSGWVGWKKLSKDLEPKIKQHDDYLGSENPIKILCIQYRAAGRAQGEWQFFYIDDISASVRDKYKDREIDD